MKRQQYYWWANVSSGFILLGLLVFALLRVDWPHVVFILPLMLVHVVLSRRNMLSAGFFFLFPFVAFLATLGSKHTLNLYAESEMYDKLVHLVTAFVITYFIGSLFRFTPLGKLHTHAIYLFLIIFSFGLSVGVFWEIFEWLYSFFSTIILNESIGDVVTDLLIDAIGAAIAGVLLVRRVKVWGE